MGNIEDHMSNNTVEAPDKHLNDSRPFHKTFEGASSTHHMVAKGEYQGLNSLEKVSSKNSVNSVSEQSSPSNSKTFRMLGKVSNSELNSQIEFL